MTDIPTSSSDSPPPSAESQQELPAREVRYRHSRQFLPILKHLGVTLLVSTYEAGKLVSIGQTIDGDQSKLGIEFAHFRRAMGIAARPRASQASNPESPHQALFDQTLFDEIAVGSHQSIDYLVSAREIASRMEPQGQLQDAFLYRRQTHTGDVQIHDMAYDDQGKLWFVNTLFSCLCHQDERYSFVPQWKPSFIDQYAAEDRCHLNGLAMRDGKPFAVTMLGTSNQRRGWRESKANGGVVVSVQDDEVITNGLCMPHSPRVHPAHPNKLFVLESGKGLLLAIDLQTGKYEEVCQYPGYGRGLALTSQFAFVGLSRGRQRSVFGGVPIFESKDPLRCGITVIDLKQNREVAFFEFESGVDELFEVCVIPGTVRTGLLGPASTADGRAPVWLLPSQS